MCDRRKTYFSAMEEYKLVFLKTIFSTNWVKSYGKR